MPRASVLVLDIGGTKIAGGIVNPGGTLQNHATIPTRPAEGGSAVLDRVVALAQRMAVDYPEHLDAVGIATAGDVDPHTGAISYATATIPHWLGLPVRDRLAAGLGLPAFVDNDGNAMALGEALDGAGRSYRSIVAIVVGTGIGGGIVLDGHIQRGAHGAAGRLGHVIVDYRGRRPCPCGGAGCLEALAAAPALVADFRERVGDAGIRARGAEPEALDVRALATWALAGDSEAAGAIQRGAFYLGVGIASLLNTLDPDIVVVGGGVAQVGETYFAEVRQVARDRAQPLVKATPIVPAHLGPQANLIGAAELAWQGLRG